MGMIGCAAHGARLTFGKACRKHAGKAVLIGSTQVLKFMGARCMRVCCLAVCPGGILVRLRFGYKFAFKAAELFDQVLFLRDLCLRVLGFKACLRETLRSFGKVVLLGHTCVESCLVVHIGLVELGQEDVDLFEANVDGRNLVVAAGGGHNGILERLCGFKAVLGCRNATLGLGEGFACMGKLLYLLVKVLHERLCAGA